MRLIFWTIVLAVAAGCSPNKQEPVQTSSPADTPHLTLADKELWYRQEGTCDDKFIKFNTMMAYQIKIGERDGKDIMVESHIRINQDKTFEALVTERYIEKNTKKEMRLVFDFGDWNAVNYQFRNRRFTGIATESDGKIHFGDFMDVAFIRGYEDSVWADITYKKDVISPGLKGKTAQGSMDDLFGGFTPRDQICTDYKEKMGEFVSFVADRDKTSQTLWSLKTGKISQVKSKTKINNVEFFLYLDGHFEIVANLDSGGLEKNFIAKNGLGIWTNTKDGFSLFDWRDFKWITLKMNSHRDGVVARFLSDINVYNNEAQETLETQDLTVDMTYGPSEISKDDLTDNLQ